MLTSTLSILFLLAAARAQVPVDQLPKKIFLEHIAPLHRPPGGEGPARHLVITEVGRAAIDPGWKNASFTILQDEFENLVVRVPGTGRFAKSRYRVAVQAHLDMVSLGEGIENGVDVVETNGRLHSRGHKTTLGADNGFGFAMALALLRDPTIEHPPLELVFTLSEEVGLKGAQAFDIPLESRCMINLDSEKEGAVVYGCIGSRRTIVEREVEVAPTSTDFLTVDLAITELPAGHSGIQIHEARPNAAVHGAAIVEQLLRQNAGLSLASLEVGHKDRLNSIPGEFRASLAVSPRSASNVRRQAERAFAKFVASTPGADDAKLRVSLAERRAENVLTSRSALHILDFLTRLPNGVLIEDEVHPNGWRTSSNLGWVSQLGTSFKFGWMIRSWDDAEAEDTETLMNAFVADHLPKTGPVSSEIVSRSPAWRTDPDSWLFKLVERVQPDIKKETVAGGLELAYFPLKYPTIEAALALGPNIYDPHSPKESAETESLARTFNLLRRILVEIGTCDGNLSSPPAP